MTTDDSLREVVRFACLVSVDGTEHARCEYRYGDALELTPRPGTWHGLRIELLDTQGRSLIAFDLPPMRTGDVASLAGLPAFEIKPYKTGPYR